MLGFLLAGDGTVVAETTTRSQLPLLLHQAVVVTGGAVDIAVETDTAFDATVFIGAALIPAELATETDTARDVTVVISSNIALSVSPAEETGTAFDLTVASSTPAAFPGITYPGPNTYPWSGDIYAVDIAVETDTAFNVAGAVYDRLFPVTTRTGISIVPATVEAEDLVPVTPT